MLFTGVSRWCKIRIQTVSTVLTGGELETKAFGSCQPYPSGFTCRWKETANGETWDVQMSYRENTLYVVRRSPNAWSSETFRPNEITKGCYGTREGVVSMDIDTVALNVLRDSQGTQVAWMYDVISGGQVVTEMMTDIVFGEVA